MKIIYDLDTMRYAKMYPGRTYLASNNPSINIPQSILFMSFEYLGLCLFVLLMIKMFRLKSFTFVTSYIMVQRILLGFIFSSIVALVLIYFAFLKPLGNPNCCGLEFGVFYAPYLFIILASPLLYLHHYYISKTSTLLGQILYFVMIFPLIIAYILFCFRTYNWGHIFSPIHIVVFVWLVYTVKSILSQRPTRS